MTENKLRGLISHAVELDRQVSVLTEELKEAKAAIVAEAQSREDQHEVTDGGGRAWVAEGADGCVARVSFPVPSLRAKIDGEGKAIEKIRGLAGKAFDRLFRPAVSYKPVDGFRDEAANLLGKDANRLIKACCSESAPRVSFETKEKSED